jgi:heme/copper-type cytochrome/quinol oxidase subunit 4
MKKSLFIVYIVLLFLTFVSALVPTSDFLPSIAVILIMGFASVKFLLVVFHFMELKKAHSFWKVSLTMTLALIVLVIICLK